MCKCAHGSAVTVLLLTLLAAPGVSGCQRGSTPGGGQQGDPVATTQPRQESPPQLREDVVERQGLTVPDELTRLRPVAVLPAGEQLMVYNAMGPLRLMVARPDGSALAEVDVRAGQILVVDRRTGVRLAGQTLVRGPLDEQAEYSLFALPAGGVRQESVQSRIRPETPEERRQRLEEEERLRREQEGDPTTRPDGPPGGG